MGVEGVIRATEVSIELVGDRREAMARRAPRRALSFLAPPGMTSGSRQRDHEGRAGADLALDAQVSSHATRQIAGYGQPEPDALMRAVSMGVHLHERLEDRFELVGRDSDAGIADHDANHVAN